MSRMDILRCSGNATVNHLDAVSESATDGPTPHRYLSRVHHAIVDRPPRRWDVPLSPCCLSLVGEMSHTNRHTVGQTWTGLVL